MRKIKTLLLTLSVLFSALTVFAQGDMPVKFSVKQQKISDKEVDVIFTAKVDKGWHVYGKNIPSGGPTPASIKTEKAEGAKPKGGLVEKGSKKTEYDEIFGMKLSYFEGAVSFVQRYEITANKYNIKGYLEFGACDDQQCMPPTAVDFNFSGDGPKDAPEAKEMKDEATSDTSNIVALTDTTKKADSIKVDSALIAAGHDKWWTSSKEELSKFDGDKVANNSWLYIFLMGFVGGLLALFTPCVWPIIPMTVSFFLKRSKDKAKGIKDAITYGVSIIVIYLSLGVAVSLIFGAETLNSLATNAVFNILFFLLLVVFALSFFGWFEIKLPSSWADKVDTKASNTSGLLSIFLMAFTLSLVSFSCTAPIVGLLLVEVSTSGNWVGPALGMFGFALALALPFTLFALFPAWLKQTPKSGSWMNTIKIVLGFIELAFAFKFFSVADLAYGWGLLDREVFLSIWIVIFGLLGLYLIGKLHFQSDGDEKKPMPVLCIMLGMASLAFTIYMIPGLWGAPCKAVSAFSPPINTQDFNLNNKVVHPAYTNYEEGMAAAAATGKPVMLDFTGFGCVNCRKMEIAVWTDPTVADKLNKDYILISLFVDDKTPLPKPIEVTHNGTSRTLRTVGDKWSYLEEMKFGYLTQPLYVIVDNEGNPLNKSFSYKEDVPEFLEFLDTGIKNYKK